MEEKTIIKGEKYSIEKIRMGVWITGLVLAIVYSLWDMSVRMGLASELSTIIIIIFGVLGVIVYAGLSKVEISVTDKRVYGTAAFGKRVDLPLDMISAVGTSALLKGIAVTTASGAIKFLMIKNKDEIHSELSKLLIERQGKQPAATTIRQEVQQSNAEELRKYKDLLDSGTITQEEFDAKKKQLLGL